RQACGAARLRARVLRRLPWRDADHAAQAGIVDRRGARRAALRDRPRAQRKEAVMIELSLVAKVTLVLLVALAAVRLARRASASSRSLILGAPFGVLLVLPIVSSALSPVAVGVPLLAARTPANSVSTSSRVSIESVETNALAEIRNPAVTSGGKATISWAALLRAVWLAGSIVLLVPLAGTLWRMPRMRRKAIRWNEG